MTESDRPYVSRGGLKLEAALDAFDLDVTGLTCADLGANVGGFTDCLLQRGASRIYSVDTGYGTLAWTLRNDERVVVLERTNAIHFEPNDMDDFEGVDLVAIDLGWTRQQHAVPAALRWLRTTGGSIISLIKPHYESDRQTISSRGTKGVLDIDTARGVMNQVIEAMPALGVEVKAHIESPLLGGASRGRKGNVEFLAHLQRAESK